MALDPCAAPYHTSWLLLSWHEENLGGDAYDATGFAMEDRAASPGRQETLDTGKGRKVAFPKASPDGVPPCHHPDFQPSEAVLDCWPPQWEDTKFALCEASKLAVVYYSSQRTLILSCSHTRPSAVVTFS